MKVEKLSDRVILGILAIMLFGIINMFSFTILDDPIYF